MDIINFLNIEFCNALLRFAICFVVNWIIVDKLYYSKSNRRDFYFTFMLISVAIYFLVCIMMNMDRGKATMGVGLGLFGIFSIMRYRTDSMPVREMTYLFVIVCLSVVHAMIDIEDVSVNTAADIVRLAIVDSIFVLAIVLCERKLKIQSTKLIQYDRPEMVKPGKRQELIADLEQRTGLKIHDVEVGGIDFLKDSVVLRITYDGTVNNDTDKQFTVRKSQWREIA
jgi:hypothetical protein